MRALLSLFVVGLLLSSSALLASVEKIPDPALQARMDDLTKELRCLKCQNQTIFDSQAGLADDLKRQIRSQIMAGKSDEEIIKYLTDRYGDFVLYKPRLNMVNVMLWVGPFLLMVIGAIVLVRQIKVRQPQVEELPLTSEEKSRVTALIGKGGEK